MLQVLKVVAAIAALSSVIPLCVWAITGNWRHALHAWKEWAKIMGVMALIGCGFGLIGFLAGA